MFFVRSVRLLTTPSFSNSVNKQQTPPELGTLAKDFSKRSSAAGVAGCCKLFGGCWKPSSDLDKQCRLQTTEPALQSHVKPE